MAKKSTCNVTREEFAQNAQPIEYSLAGVPLVAEVKEFSTGSLGWNTNAKVTLKVGEKMVNVQVGLNLTIVGSKELPRNSSGGGEQAGDA
jgi:hypothetical protein